MTEYIDRQKAIDTVLRMYERSEGDMEFFRDVMVESLKVLPGADVVPLGVEMWLDRFDIETRQWMDENGTVAKVSFVIKRREREDDETAC